MFQQKILIAQYPYVYASTIIMNANLAADNIRKNYSQDVAPTSRQKKMTKIQEIFRFSTLLTNVVES